MPKFYKGKNDLLDNNTIDSGTNIYVNYLFRERVKWLKINRKL